MLVPIDLKNRIIAATQGQINAASALSSMGIAIATYILQNAEFLFVWTATNPKGDPDPKIKGTGKFISVVITLSPSLANTPGVGVNFLANQITTGMRAAVYKLNPPWNTASGVCSDIPPLTLSITGNSRDAAMLMMATQICNWLTAYKPSIPDVGARGAFTGSGKVIMIT